MKYICKTRCYYKDREWLVGEVMHQEAGDVPKHFKKVVSKKKTPDRSQKKSEAKTMIDVQNEEAKALLIGKSVDDGLLG